MAAHHTLKGLASPCIELRHEFTNSLSDTGGLIVRGVYLGESEVGGRIYSRYQFAGVLAGSKPRVLEVLFAKNQEYSSQLRERKRLEEGTNAAFFFSAHIANSEEVKVPTVYFTRHYPSENVTNYIGRSMNMDVRMDVDSDIDKIFTILLLRTDSKTNELVWDARDVDEHLRWVVRNRPKYGFSHLIYLYTLPLDTVTLPYQIFGYFVVDEPIF